MTVGAGKAVLLLRDEANHNNAFAALLRPSVPYPDRLVGA